MAGSLSAEQTDAFWNDGFLFPVPSGSAELTVHITFHFLHAFFITLRSYASRRDSHFPTTLLHRRRRSSRLMPPHLDMGTSARRLLMMGALTRVMMGALMTGRFELRPRNNLRISQASRSFASFTVMNLLMVR